MAVPPWNRGIEPGQELERAGGRKDFLLRLVQGLDGVEVGILQLHVGRDRHGAER
jgi:hypothetical protein